MSYDDYIRSQPRGQLWSYGIEVQGVPDFYTDGVTSWQGVGRLSGHTHVEGALADRGFSLDFLCDPQDPLQVGSGITFHLVDDGTDRVFHTYSKQYKGFKGHGRLAVDLGAAATDTTLEVIPLGGTTTIPNNAYLFVGGETMKVSSSPATNTYTVTRGLFDTLRDRHRVFDEIRPQVTTSPTTFGGRIVTLWAAPVEDLTDTLVAEEAVPLWAGVISFVRLSDERVSLECEPLSYLLTRDWPQVLPSAQLRRDSRTFRLSPEDHRISPFLRANRVEYNAGALVSAGIVNVGGGWVPLGYYDDTDTFVELEPVERVVDFSTFLSWVQDTVIEADLFSGFTGDFTGAFSLHADFPEEDGEPVTVRGTFTPPPLTPTGTFIGNGSLIRATVGTRGAISVNSGSVNAAVLTTFINGQFITDTQTTIVVKMDRPAHPFEVSWHPDNMTVPVGVAVIGTGEDHETILYRTVTVDSSDPSIVTLSGITRGYGGTEAKYWGASREENDDGTMTSVAQQGTITVTQLLAITEDVQDGVGAQFATKVPVGHVPLFILLSSPDREQNGDFDRLGGYRKGMRVPERWVDVTTFTDIGDRYMVPQVSAFWVNEQNKGKEPLAELLKMSGVHLVTRRFTDSDGDAQFGLSLEAIDQPLTTATSKVLDDDAILSGSRNSTTHNERLVVNSTKTKPHESWGSKSGKGDEVFVWDEWSIAEYGRGKQLEFKPSALLNRFDNIYGGSDYYDREALAAWMYEVSTRWFAAFGRGSYTADVECVAPTVYQYVPGDLVAVNLTTLRNEQGDKGVVAPARVIKVHHEYGANARGKLTFRLALDEFAELAPSMRLVRTSATTGISWEGSFTRATTRNPFTGFTGAKETAWFDPARHGGPIRCGAWVRGQAAATYAEVLVTDVNHDTGVVTVSTAGGDAELPGTGGATIIMTLAPYHRTTTALSRLYAFLGSVEDELPPPAGGVDENKVYA